MKNIASFEFNFIYVVFVFYGLLFLFYTLNGNSLYGLTTSSLSQTAPSSLTDWLLIVPTFFATLFIQPFTAGSQWAYFGFLNWAIFGTMIYIALRIARGGG